MKSLRRYLIFGAILIVIYITAQFNRPKSVDWTETLSNKDKIPFGTFILNNRLKDIFVNSKIVHYRRPIYNAIEEDSIKNSSYLVVCSNIEVTKSDFDALTKYIKQGNDVFIAAEYMGKAFEKYLNVQTEVYLKIGYDATPVTFLDTSIDSKKYYTIDRGSSSCYFSRFDTAKATVIGENKYHKANFIRYTFGKGSLFLLTNPRLFSNYSLLSADGAAYAATCLSFIKSTPNIIFDEYYTQGDEGSDSPMRVFLNNYALQWAYYLSIATILIFVLFEMKRRQRIIPVIEPLTNSTLDFVTVVGQVYYEKRDNANIAHKKILYFLSYLRDAYQIKTTKFDSEFVEILTTKLALDPTFSNELAGYLQYISTPHKVTDHELIELNKLIEKFYIKSR